MIPGSCLSPVVGRPLANTICMILVIIRMKVLAEKRKELFQTIALLIGSLRTQKGCRRCDFCQNIEDENELCILEEWDTRENLNSHLKSERFRVLRGAMSLLEEPYEMMVYTVLHPAETVGPILSLEGSRICFGLSL
jgi:quinol monooxygenase YgiN